jgi:hypothetical protein
LALLRRQTPALAASLKEAEVGAVESLEWNVHCPQSSRLVVPSEGRTLRTMRTQGVGFWTDRAGQGGAGWVRLWVQVAQ